MNDEYDFSGYASMLYMEWGDYRTTALKKTKIVSDNKNMDGTRTPHGEKYTHAGSNCIQIHQFLTL